MSVCLSVSLVVHILGSSLSLSLSGQMAAAKLSSWNSALVSHYLPLLATEKLQQNCRNLAQQSIEGKRSAVVQQSEVHQCTTGSADFAL